MNQLKAETQRVNKLREGIQRKLRDVENHKVEVEQQRETLRNQVLAMERGRNSVRLLPSTLLFITTNQHMCRHSAMLDPTIFSCSPYFALPVGT